VEDGSNHEQEGSHSETSKSKVFLPSRTFDTENDEDGSGDDLDDSVYSGCQEGSRSTGDTDRFEDGRSLIFLNDQLSDSLHNNHEPMYAHVVIDRVLSRPLLANKEHDRDKEPLGISLSSQLVVPNSSLGRLVLLLTSGDDLRKLHLNDRRVFRKITNPGEVLLSIGVTAFGS
jgi:hypothetical protein